MIFTRPVRRHVAPDSGYPGGWIGIKPLAPTINWANKFMARCVGNESRTAIAWCDNNRQPHELVRNETNQRPAGSRPIPTDYDGEPCARHLNNKGLSEEISWFSSMPAPPANDKLTIIAMVAPQDWHGGAVDGYCHIWTDSNMWDSNCNYAMVLRNRQFSGDQAVAHVFANKGGIINAIGVQAGINGADWPAGTWAIIGAHIDSQSGQNEMIIRRPSAPVIDLTPYTQAPVTFNGSGGATQTYIGINAYDSTSYMPRAHIGFVFHLPISVSSPELVDLVDNPYQVFNWP